MESNLSIFNNIGLSDSIKILFIIDDFIPDYFLELLKGLSLEEKTKIHIYSTINSAIPKDLEFIKNLNDLNVLQQQRLFYNSKAIIYQSDNLDIFWQVACAAPIILLYYKSVIVNKINKDNSIIVFSGSFELNLVIDSVLNNSNKSKSILGTNIRMELKKNFTISLKVKPEINKENIQQINDYNYLRHKIMWVNPIEIVYGQKGEFYINYFSGNVYDGDWDKEVYFFDEEMLFYKSYLKRLETGSWESTEYYQHHLTQINNGIIKWSCSNKEEWDERCKRLDSIYKSMRDEGFVEDKIVDDYISVNIGRNGEFIFNNGRHRLSFAKILKIEKIPVRVTVIHKQWFDFRERILIYALSMNNAIYTTMIHPDLQDFPVTNADRFDLIKSYLNVKHKTVLDIGTHWGFMSFKFAEMNKTCFAVEVDKRYFYFLDKLNAISKHKINLIYQDIFEFVKINNKFDTVLAFAIFHHFLKKEDLYNKLIVMLKSLDMKEMFFQPHNPNENQMKNAYKNYNPKEFCEFIISNSCLTHYKKISESYNRPIYYLFKGL